MSSEPERPAHRPAPLDVDESGRFPMKRSSLLDILAAVGGMLSRGEQVDINQTLRLIGQAVGVDRMYLFENHPDPASGRSLCSQRFEWANGAVSAEIDNPALQSLPYDEISDRLEAVLRRGEVFAAVVSELEAKERILLEAQGIRSICMVPVSIEGELWGFVGFDDCHRDRRWSEEEISVLRLVAAILGGHWSRERMRDELARSAERYRDVVDNVEEAIVETDGAGRITFLSRAWETLLGHPIAESLGRPIVDFYSERSRAEALRVLTEAATNDRSECFHEVEVVDRHGRERVMQLLCRMRRDEHGRVVGALGTLRDVTEQRWAEEALRQRQLDESLSTLAGGIAHDFNNVLHGLLVSAEVLERLVDDPQGRELLSLIRTSGERMADLTRHLLAYARGGRYEVVPLDPTALVEDALKIVRARIPPGVRLEVASDEGGWVVHGDRGQLFQVLLNLLMNATEAMAAGGTLRVGVEAIELSAEHALVRDGRLEAGPYGMLAVTDEGEGIEGPRLARIFEPYFSTKAQGRGLGLAAARGIAASHGGTITVESKLGEGSTFRVLLPRRVGAAEARPRRVRGGRGDGVVLVVDDEEAIRRSTCASLTDDGHEVVSAADGAEALALLDAHRGRVRVALVDYLLPDMDGGTLTTALLARAPDLRVVICTGYDRDEIAASAALDGVPVLQKPFDRDALRALLETRAVESG